MRFSLSNAKLTDFENSSEYSDTVSVLPGIITIISAVLMLSFS
jgi:hypothetical protein